MKQTETSPDMVIPKIIIIIIIIKSSKMAARKNVSTSQLAHKMATNFQRLCPCFRCQATCLNSGKLCLTFGCFKLQRWQQKLKTICKITTYISAPIHDNNKIPTTILRFSGVRQHDWIIENKVQGFYESKDGGL